MQMELIASGGGKPIGKLAVVRNFRQVIEARDMSLMKKELYQFLNLYCSFIARSSNVASVKPGRNSGRL